ILQMLDGSAGLDEIKARFEREFLPQRLNLRQLQAFIGRLHDDGLIVADTPGQGEELFARDRKLRRREWLGAFSNLLAIRFRGMDPEPFLRRLAAWCAPVFSPWFLAGCVLLVLGAVSLVTVRF